MCKAPRPGASKTRLARAIGAVAASELSVCFLRDVAATIEAVPEILGRKGYAVYAPAGTERVLRELFSEKFGLLLEAGGELLGAPVLGPPAPFFFLDDCVFLGDRASPTPP